MATEFIDCTCDENTTFVSAENWTPEALQKVPSNSDENSVSGDSAVSQRTSGEYTNDDSKAKKGQSKSKNEEPIAGTSGTGPMRRSKRKGRMNPFSYCRCSNLSLRMHEHRSHRSHRDKLRRPVNVFSSSSSDSS